ncbi:hypothetical protein K9M48_03100 [Candidatus Gracilibacteria bacterium]|nr:hypothetical protein [Candidatus Gracilibacteria bacterium]
MTERNGLAKSYQVAGSINGSRDHESVVDSCVGKPGQFERLIINTSCRKILSYAKKRLPRIVKDPEQQNDLLNKINNKLS